MTDYGPDSLRRCADTADEDNRPDIAGVLRSHADAWEADLDVVKNYEGDDSPMARLERDNAALREQADVDRSFIEQYQREVSALRKRLVFFGLVSPPKESKT